MHTVVVARGQVGGRKPATQERLCSFFGTTKDFCQGIAVPLGLKYPRPLDVTQLAYRTISRENNLPCFLNDGTCFGTQRTGKKAVEIRIDAELRFQDF